MLSTLLICNNVVNVGASVLATDVALKVFSSNALAYATGIMTFFLLVFGEIIPKNFGATHTNRLSLIIAPIVYYVGLVLHPLIVFFDFLTQKVFRIRPPSHKITEEEIRSIIDMAKEEGGINKEEKELIHRIFKFDDINVSEIMTPRTDMVTLHIDRKLKDALDILKKEKQSRIPVFSENNDKIVGIFYFKDALKNILQKKYDEPLEKFIRKPFFVPATKKIDELLKVMQKKKEQMAIVVDEHGGVAGLITMEDILEEIVGEIQDETEKVEPEIRKIDRKTFKVLGKAPIDEVNKQLRTRLKKQDDFDTLSGYILHKLGKIPAKGEEIDLKSAKITIKKIEENRIVEVEVKKK